MDYIVHLRCDAARGVELSECAMVFLNYCMKIGNMIQREYRSKDVIGYFQQKQEVLPSNICYWNLVAYHHWK